MRTKPTLSVLTESDEALVSIGRLPIDVDPPRVMSEREKMMCDPDLRKSILENEKHGFVAMVHRGYVCYKLAGE